MYHPIIGLEIHLQPKIKSKMFCSCSAEYFGKAPNTHTCPVCLGLPGALPVPNKAAIEHCIKLALALNCSINKESKFDRKNYFYPDLPKGYQISQYDQPIGKAGFIEVDLNGDAKRFRITRVHMEEDTGKSIHSGNLTLLDFNKSGVPLIEIVTEPDFTSKEEVDVFAKRLRQIIRYCGISDADMEKGQMRYELNISMSENGQLPDYKVEVKNIGSISLLQKIIDYEIKRQTALLEKGEKLQQETRGAKDMSGVTLSQRIKEGSADYRYFPEPDIPLMRFDKKLIEKIRTEIPELPQNKKWLYVKNYKIETDTAETIISNKGLFTFFEQGLVELKKKNLDKKLAQEFANWLVGDLRKLTKKADIKVTESKVTASHLAELIELLDSGNLRSSMAKEVLTKIFQTGKSPKEVIKDSDLGLIKDSKELEKIIKKVLKNSPKIVSDYKNKNPNAIKFLLGQVMKETRGQADPLAAKKLLERLIR